MNGCSHKKRLVSFRGFMLSFVCIALLIIHLVYYTPEAVAQPKPIKIGGSLGLTGKLAETSLHYKRAYDMWQEQINSIGSSYGMPNSKPGLIDGRPVEINIFDDRSDPGRAVRLYEQLVQEDYDLILAPYSSGMTKAVAPVIENEAIAKTPALCLGASSDPIWKEQHRKWMVQVFGPTMINSSVVSAAAEQNCKTLAFAYENTEFPQLSRKAFTKYAVDASVKVVFDESYEPDTTNFIPLLTKIKPLNPCTFVGGGYLPSAIALTKAAKAINFRPSIFALDHSIVDPAYQSTVGDLAFGICGSVQYDPRMKSPGNAEFRKEWLKRHNYEPTEHAAIAYGGLQLYEHAVRNAASVDREKVRNQLFSQKIETVFGPYRVAPLGDPNSGLQLGKEYILIQWQKDGNQLIKEVVWPEKYKTANIIFPLPPWDK